MKIGRLRRDDSAHWYLIPIEKIVTFDKMSEKLCSMNEMSSEFDKLCGEFDDVYGQYALGGGPYELSVIIPE